MFRCLVTSFTVFLVTALHPVPAACQSPERPEAHVTAGLTVPIDFNGSAPNGNDRAGRIGIALGAWASAVAQLSPAVAVGVIADIPGFYERGYRRPGGGSFEATLDHRDILVAAIVETAPNRNRRLDTIWSAGLGLAHSTTRGTIVTTGPFLPPTPPRAVSVVEYGVLVLGGAYPSVRVSEHTRVVGGATLRWISRPPATRNEGIASFGVTLRIGLSVRL